MNPRAAWHRRRRRRFAEIARELDIDLTRVRGSEAGGRITMADVRGYIQRLQQLASQGGAAPGAGTAGVINRYAERSHRFRQVGTGPPGKNVAAPAYGQPAHGGIVDDDPKDQSIRRRRYHSTAGAAQEVFAQPMRKKAPI